MDDNLSLENSIRNEAEQQIKAIARKEAEEIRALDDAFDAELDHFKDLISAQTDARIRQESAKIENRAGLNLKKLKIREIEAFIDRVVEDVMKTIRNSRGYKKYLLEAVTDAAGRIPGRVELHMTAEDLVYENEIRVALEAAGPGRDIIFQKDDSIRWGGCIIVDVTGGRIFDSTIERAFFRKSLLIRREVMRVLGTPVEAPAKESSCKLQ